MNKSTPTAEPRTNTSTPTAKQATPAKTTTTSKMEKSRPTAKLTKAAKTATLQPDSRGSHLAAVRLEDAAGELDHGCIHLAPPDSRRPPQ